MRVLLLLSCFWLITASVVFEPSVRTIFAVQVNMQSNSQMYSIVVFLHNGRVPSHKKNLTRDDFVKFATGKWPSIYNPKRENLLEQNKILCGLAKDSITNKDVVYCSPLDSLWKLRYADYPFQNGNERGWSQELYKPSSKQAIFLLQNYGVTDIDLGFFADTSFWKIMRDVQDPDWIRKYKNLK
jgi:hypothetical protein